MEFENEIKKSYVIHQANSSKLVEFLLRHSSGTIKTQKQAEVILLAFCICIILSAIFWSVKILTPKPAPFPKIYQEDLSPEFKQTLTPEELLAIPYKYEQ